MNKGWKEGAICLAVPCLVLIVGFFFVGCASVRAPAPVAVEPEPQAAPPPSAEQQQEPSEIELADVTVVDRPRVAEAAGPIWEAGVPESPVPNILQQRFEIKVKDADLHDVVQSLVKGKGLNVIIPRRLEGKVTLDVKNVTLEDIFDVILRSFGYSWRIDGKFLIITRGEPVRVFRVKHAPLSDVTSQVRNIVGGKGQVIMDSASRTLTLVNTDPTVVKYVDDYIKAVDVMPPQVLIETELVEVALNKEHELGIDWTFKDIDLSGWSGLRGKANTYLTGFMTGRVLFANLSNEHIEVLLKALAKQGDVNMVSCPKVTALDRKVSRLEIYQNIPYTDYVKVTEINPMGVAYTEWKPVIAWREVGTRLEIRPEVSPDGYVTLSIKPDIETLVGWVGGQPETNRRMGDLYARARDGRTIVIGGFMFDNVENHVYKVPLLGDIPYIGNAFRFTNKVKKKSELVIFLTPHILTDTNITDFAEAERATYHYLTSKPVGLPDIPK